MNSDGTYRDCSNATDSTGYYIYREDGKPNGQCLGLDFEQARRDYDGQGSCQTDSKTCKDSLVLPFVSLLLLIDIRFRSVLKCSSSFTQSSAFSEGCHLHDGVWPA